MKHRQDWPAWVAASAGVLGLVGLASAQTVITRDIEDLRSEWAMGKSALLGERDEAAVFEVPSPIPDYGRSTDVLRARQLMLVKHGA